MARGVAEGTQAGLGTMTYVPELNSVPHRSGVLHVPRVRGGGGATGYMRVLLRLLLHHPKSLSFAPSLPASFPDPSAGLVLELAKGRPPPPAGLSQHSSGGKVNFVKGQHFWAIFGPQTLPISDPPPHHLRPPPPPPLSTSGGADTPRLQSPARLVSAPPTTSPNAPSPWARHSVGPIVPGDGPCHDLNAARYSLAARLDCGVRPLFGSVLFRTAQCSLPIVSPLVWGVLVLVLGLTLLPGPHRARPRRAMLPRTLGGSWLPLRVREATGVVPLPPSR